jgi:hypothetical protein
MQIPIHSQHALITHHGLRQISFNLGSNQIGSAGVLHLSKAKWEKLNSIHLRIYTY